MLRLVCPPPLRLFDLLPGLQTCDWGEKATPTSDVSGMQMVSIVVGEKEDNSNAWMLVRDVAKLQQRCRELNVSSHGFIWQLQDRIQGAECAQKQAGQATQK